MKLPFNVSFYDKLFDEEETTNLYNLPDLCCERLQLYNILKVNETITVDELKTKLGENSLRHLLESEYNIDLKKARQSDYITHWILKVFYCDTYPKFFIKCECRWFKIRLNNMPYNSRLQFFKAYLDLIHPTDEETQRLNLTKGVWYKFPFTKATNLTRRREYPISYGNLYIPENKLTFIAEEKLETYLTKNLQHCKKMLTSMCQQLQYLKDVLTLVKPYEFSNYKNRLKLEEIDSQVRNFPLCMKLQYEGLISKHHLKYFSRIQYGLFLKGIGLSVEDAIEMWKNEFTLIMSEEYFQKQYVYYIKHLYGLVGGKINYSPQSCDTILESHVNGDLIHGCPFKHLSKEALQKRLNQDDIPIAIINDIIQLRKKEKYKAACTQYFIALHDRQATEMIDHPIAYYTKACENCRITVDIEDLYSDEDF